VKKEVTTADEVDSLEGRERDGERKRKRRERRKGREGREGRWPKHRQMRLAPWKEGTGRGRGRGTGGRVGREGRERRKVALLNCPFFY
jgi:hypothetical protein